MIYAIFDTHIETDLETFRMGFPTLEFEERRRGTMILHHRRHPVLRVWRSGFCAVFIFRTCILRVLVERLERMMIETLAGFSWRVRE